MRRESDSPMAKHFVVTAPNLTVFERLKTDFKPAQGGQDIFDKDPLIPVAWRGEWNMSVVLQDEASGARWTSKIDFVTHPTTVILIPFFLRTPSGAWHRRTDFSGHLVVDRFRLLRTLAGTATDFSKLPALKHVASCLAAKEDAY